MEKLNKCPACGALRTSFSAICPDCGYEYHDVEVSQTTQKFFEQITKYDEAIAQSEENNATNPGIKIGVVLLWLFFFPFMLIYYLLKLAANSKVSEFKGNKKLKANAITAFPIPNSRNDLLETAMMTEGQIKKLSFSNVLGKSGTDIQMWNEIWLSKLGSIVKKAEIALKDDSSCVNQIKSLYTASEDIVKANSKMRWIEIGILALLFIGMMILASFS